MLVQQQSFGGRIVWYCHVLHWRACLHTVSGDWDAARENSLLTHHCLLGEVKVQSTKVSVHVHVHAFNPSIQRAQGLKVAPVR